MTIKTLISSACIGAVAMIYLQAENNYAQAPPPEPTAVITSGSGAERHLLSHQRILDRVGLGPNQVVTVTLQFPRDTGGKPVMVGALDGGGLTANDGMENLFVDEDGTVAFSFQAGATPGLYRLIVQLGANDYRLEFWVLDLDHPQNNPSRVQIVN